jgi:hypothetical protein
MASFRPLALIPMNPPNCPAKALSVTITLPLLYETSLYFGHAQPLSTHSLTFWTNSAWLSGGAFRPSPGFHPHNTSGSWLT